MTEIKNLSVSYGKNNILDDLNLNIESGKFTCVLGESGSGKTTLLNAIANLVEYQGEIKREELSYAFSQSALFPNLTVRENLALVCSDSRKISEMLTLFKINEKENSYPLHLSAGQRQRVSLARALLFNKPLILLDEPLANLDIGLKFYLLEKIKDFQKESGATVLMVTHDIKEAVSVADKIIVLSNGKIVKEITDINENAEKELFGVMMNLSNLN